MPATLLYPLSFQNTIKFRENRGGNVFIISSWRNLKNATGQYSLLIIKKCHFKYFLSWFSQQALLNLTHSTCTSLVYKECLVECYMCISLERHLYIIHRGAPWRRVIESSLWNKLSLLEGERVILRYAPGFYVLYSLSNHFSIWWKCR